MLGGIKGAGKKWRSKFGKEQPSKFWQQDLALTYRELNFSIYDIHS
jgi:hypothetical protein